MPEYLAPGVYVEEVSFRTKSIEGVSTTTTAFIGPTGYGPIHLVPDIITSLPDFERVYGTGQQLEFNAATSPVTMDNYLWHAVRAFFEEGGTRLYVVRTFRPLTGSYVYPPVDFAQATQTNGFYDDGHARASIPHGGTDNALHIRARFPGAQGNMLVRITVGLGQNILGGDAKNPRLGAIQPNDIVWINEANSQPAGGPFYIASQIFDPIKKVMTWNFISTGQSPASTIALSQLVPDPDPKKSDSVRVVALTVTVTPADPNELPPVWSNVPLDPNHILNGTPDSLVALFAAEPNDLASARTLPITITLGDHVATGLDVLHALIDEQPSLQDALNSMGSSDPIERAKATVTARSVDVLLEGGNDGLRPGATEYEGKAEEDSDFKTGLKALEDLDDISILAAPGSSFGYDTAAYHDDADTIINLLIAHSTLMRYQIAVLDSGDNQTIAQVRALRARLDSTYAALYYPWVRILDPITRTETSMPPSGFVTGIYARNDTERAVYKAPANEVVRLAIGFEKVINKAQQDVLNFEGINCFRFFSGRGFRLWGARTISSDPEWKYVNLRRYFAYLEHSIDRGTQWAVFEPNNDALWANIRRTIEDFLYNEWVTGALLGDKPDKAFFVRCDRSTMTQNDLDNGRLICLVGVAPVRPAEFVIIRIGQWTADRKN